VIDQSEESPVEGDVDPALVELTEALWQRLTAGDRIDAEDYARRYPALADSIRQIVPAIRGLVSLGGWNRNKP